ncbi:MAG: monomethylamine:corrinoid methyltransferase [bacterium]|nr:monomethylamine:corrinoid methyltransferase [bacterium]
MIEKYNLSYPSDEAVPQDMAMAHRIFEAAIELLLDVGIYCRDTRKIIGFERKDIEQALDNANSSHSIGQQENEVLVGHRGLDDDRKPAIIGGACGASVSEENFLNIMMSYAKEEIDGLHTGSLHKFCGKNIKIGSPVEIMASRREAQ